LLVRVLPSTLKVSYIGYQSVDITLSDETAEFQNVALSPSPIVLDELIVTAEDLGPNIMRKVIAQKQTWWKDLSTFQVRAYSRFTYRNETDLVAVAESLSDAYWDRERGWREVVKDKRENKNIEGDFALPAAAAVNLYDDEIEIGGHHLLGVTHPDALDHYDFKLVGRRFLDRQTIYDINVAPKSKLRSAFRGRVSVIDSVYALVEAELMPNNRAFLFPPPIRALGIVMWQQFSNTGGAFWLPIGYQSEVDLEIGMMGLQFPPIKARRVSRLSDYQVNVVLADSLYEKDRDRITVDTLSVKQDSLMAKGGVVLPLTRSEAIAYENIDSTMTLEKAFKPKGFLARFIDMDDDDDGGSKKGGNSDTKRRFSSQFKSEAWFNRVDGAHLGLKVQNGSHRSRWNGEAGGAYNTGLKRWAFSGEVTGRWGERRRGFVSASGFRGTEVRFASALYDRFVVSSGQVFGEPDYFDFFWRDGVRLRAGYLFKRQSLSISGGVNIEKHASVSKTTNWDLLDRLKTKRENPPIDPGDFRSVVVRVVLSGDEKGPAPFFGKQELNVEIEHSRTGWFSDFAFTQIRMVLDWRFRTFFTRRLLPNVLDIRLVGSTFSGKLPRQRYGILDTDLGGFTTFGGFRSRVDRPYEGQTLLGIFWEHNFRTVPFEIIGWRWAVKRNLGLLVHGAHGRTWLDDQNRIGPNYSPSYVEKVHHELGVSLNGIFDLVRFNVTKRLEPACIYVSVEMARIF
jgi:hypothetical protein